MNENSFITGIFIKVMNLIFCHEEYSIIGNIIRIEINEMLPFPLFEPYDLVEAVYMGRVASCWCCFT